MRAIKLTASVAAVILAALLGPSLQAQGAERTVVVVLFDGFSPAMAEATATPNLDLISREGAWSRDLVPTLSLANHTTFQTGCWPEHHGVMSNTFYDPKRGRFSERDAANADWRTGCESLWEAAERQGMRAAALNFAGRWSTAHGKRATYANPPAAWEKLPSDEATLAHGLELLADSGPNHPDLIALYFHGPDEAAHYHGVTSPETLAEVRRADSMVGKLMAGIRALPPGREATLVIGTDHGMMNVGPMVNLGRIMNAKDIHARQAADGATAFLYLDKGESVARVEKALEKYKYAFDVYRTGHYPAYAHLGAGRRLGDLMLVTHPPYWIVGPEVLPQWANMVGINWIWPATFVPFTGGLKATHGFDPRIREMHGIFYAWGAGIAHGRRIDRLDMVDIHPTVMALLGLQPGKAVDGKVVSAALAER